MYCYQSNHLWLGRFSLRLTQLRGDLTWPRAVSRAVVAHAYLSDLDPERAAQLDAAIPVWDRPARR